MTGHADILNQRHKGLLESFCMAKGIAQDGSLISYPLGFITDLEGNLCECKDCTEHRASGPYCAVGDR